MAFNKQFKLTFLIEAWFRSREFWISFWFFPDRALVLVMDLHLILVGCGFISFGVFLRLRLVLIPARACYAGYPLNPTSNYNAEHGSELEALRL